MNNYSKRQLLRKHIISRSSNLSDSFTEKHFWQKDEFWTSISGLSSVFATIAALITVYFMYTAGIEQIDAQRPYFHVIEGPGIRKIKDGNPFRIFICTENTGIHAATEVKYNILFIERSLSRKPEYIFHKTVANDIFSKEPTPWSIDDLIIPNNCPGHYVILKISYKDSITSKEYSQNIYMEWQGSYMGEFIPAFVHVSIEDKLKIDNYLKTYKLS